MHFCNFFDNECILPEMRNIKILPLGIFGSSPKKFSEVEILEILISKMESYALPFWPWDYKTFSENNIHK